jgi:hypothetical protein
MKPSVYIETTIPSFDHEVRSAPEMGARRKWTREWWDQHRDQYEVFTSQAVLEELETGSFPIKQARHRDRVVSRGTQSNSKQHKQRMPREFCGSGFV